MSCEQGYSYSDGVAKNCSAGGTDCINGNRGYDTLQEATSRCQTVSECGGVMKYMDGKSYLRRTTDPTFHDPNAFLCARRAATPLAPLTTTGINLLSGLQLGSSGLADVKPGDPWYVMPSGARYLVLRTYTAADTAEMRQAFTSKRHDTSFRSDGSVVLHARSADPKVLGNPLFPDSYKKSTFGHEAYPKMADVIDDSKGAFRMLNPKSPDLVITANLKFLLAYDVSVDPPLYRLLYNPMHTSPFNADYEAAIGPDGAPDGAKSWMGTTTETTNSSGEKVPPLGALFRTYCSDLTVPQEEGKEVGTSSYLDPTCSLFLSNASCREAAILGDNYLRDYEIGRVWITMPSSASGFEWRAVDPPTQKPTSGRAITSAALSQRLQKYTTFESAEWESFGIRSLKADDYVAVCPDAACEAPHYYVPDVGRDLRTVEGVDAAKLEQALTSRYEALYKGGTKEERREARRRFAIGEEERYQLGILDTLRPGDYIHLPSLDIYVTPSPDPFLSDKSLFAKLENEVGDSCLCRGGVYTWTKDALGGDIRASDPASRSKGTFLKRAPQVQACKNDTNISICNVDISGRSTNVVGNTIVADCGSGGGGGRGAETYNPVPTPNREETARTAPPTEVMGASRGASGTVQGEETRGGGGREGNHAPRRVGRVTSEPGSAPFRESTTTASSSSPPTGGDASPSSSSSTPSTTASIPSSYWVGGGLALLLLANGMGG